MVAGSSNGSVVRRPNGKNLGNRTYDEVAIRIRSCHVRTGGFEVKIRHETSTVLAMLSSSLNSSEIHLVRNLDIGDEFPEKIYESVDERWCIR